METVLMHTCCAPCSLSCIEPLRSEGIEPVAFWYNPNIHPWKEYEARRDCLLGYAPSIGMEVRVHEEYGLRPFVEAVAGDLDHRCGYCYTHRLEETARYAAAHGFEWFCTTLSISPMKDPIRINALGQELGEKYNVCFLPSEFRKKDGYKRSLQLSAEYGLYRQDYCGCVFSKQERGV